MALVWHDWFATSNQGVGSQRLMINQNNLFRAHGLGSFHDLLLRVTSDPAMLLWLSGSGSTKDAPNENYGREMMELFTLGAGRGDINFHFDPKRHDPGMKTIFRNRGPFNWKDSCELCVTHPDHPSFFVTKLWGYFIAGTPDSTTRRALEQLYVSSHYDVRTVLAAILKHPSLYNGPRLVKSPVVYNAGLLRRLGDPITTTAWTWLGSLAGQQLFYPPNVAGWDDSRWLDTATWRGRWAIAQYVLQRHALQPGKATAAPDANALVNNALRFWKYPALTPKTTAAVNAFAKDAIRDAGSADWKRKQYPPMVLNGLRHLIAVSPEFQAA
jgi:uncharacterized protein (DUF1800 family)